ncbi:protein jagged-2-like [Rhincodon typus]|uniref:protein jagged-2-like n=1 Tax=Rhincodon typus TaxID=259920 RepID=UPI002030386A|nr:protein jagged-2-like [Rhincodon typus]
METQEKAAELRNLRPDVEYRIIIQTTTCGQMQSLTRTVRTVAIVLEVSTRITNVQFDRDLEDKQSQTFKDFERNFIADLVRGFNENFRELHGRGRLRIEINSIRSGSILVNFTVAVSTNVTAPTATVSDVLTTSLNTSERFNVDLQNTSITERDSCQPGLNDCSGNGTCIRLNATYTCQCNVGFNDTSPSTPGRICEDIDECQTGNSTCSALASCTNTPGNFTCSCLAGTMDTNPANPGTQCEDIDECQTGNSTCSALATCTNTPGNFTCSCLAGTMDTNPANPGTQCKDIDECRTGNNTCSDLAVCTNTPGNFSCSCFQGILDSKPSSPGTQCNDPNDCFTNEDPCALFQCLTNNDCPTRRMFKTIIILKSKNFTNDLRNPASEAFLNLSSEIRNAVVQPVQTALQDNTFNITIFGFQNGSVVANILSSLNNASNITDATLQMAIVAAIRTVDSQATVNVTGTPQVTTLAPTTSQTVSTLQAPADNSGFRVAVIVLGVILGVALLLILAGILAMVCMKRKSGQYLISGSDMLQRYNYANM